MLAIILANNCMPSPFAQNPTADLLTIAADDAIKEIVLTPLAEQPPILEDTVHTWHIENWSQLPRRHRGPVFECGGHPW